MICQKVKVFLSQKVKVACNPICGPIVSIIANERKRNASILVGELSQATPTERFHCSKIVCIVQMLHKMSRYMKRVRVMSNCILCKWMLHKMSSYISLPTHRKKIVFFFISFDKKLFQRCKITSKSGKKIDPPKRKRLCCTHFDDCSETGRFSQSWGAFILIAPALQ